MTRPRVKLRTLIFLVWLSALACAGVDDVLRRDAASSGVEVIDADGPGSSTPLFLHETRYYVGPIPIGRYPIAVLCGVAIAASVIAWLLLKRRG